MTKPEICAELDKRGVVYNSRLGEVKLQAVLDEAISKEGATGPTGPEEGSTGSTGPEETAGSTGPTAPEAVVASGVVKIIDRFGMVCRTYSLAEHGEEYVELAQNFAAKKGLRIG